MIKTLSNAEWLAEGLYRFGTEDTMVWKFVCPSCGNVATPGDFARMYVAPTRATSRCLRGSLPIDGMSGVRCTYDAHEARGDLLPGLWSVEDLGGVYVPAFPFADFIGGEPCDPSELADAG